MATLRKLKLILVVLPLALSLNLTGVLGQEGCIVPTIPGNVIYSKGWDCECDKDKPDPYVSSDTVTRGDFVTVLADYAGVACPPYNLSVSGTGFHFSNVAGPITGETDDNLKTIELWADDTACGSARVTVTDACGEQTTISVREPNNGGWYLVESEQCSHWERDWCCFCYCVDTFEIGAYRYENVWIGDKACQMTEESCGPYGGGEDLRGNACWVVGFYTPAYCGTFFQKNMWEWRCAP